MKYHAVNHVLQKRCSLYLHPMVHKNVSRRVHTIHRKSAEVKPWMRYTNSTAGSVDQRSKLPKLTEHYKTTAKLKDVVAIIWKLVQEKKIIPIISAKNSSIAFETQNSTESKSNQIFASTIAQPVTKPEVDLKTCVLEEKVRIEDGESNRAAFKTDATIFNESIPKNIASNSKVTVSENNTFKMITSQLPEFFGGINLSLRKNSIFKSATSPVKDTVKAVTSDHVKTLKTEEISTEIEKEKLVEPAKPGIRIGTLRESCDKRTRYLMHAVATSSSLASRSMRLQEFCNHLYDNPPAKSLAIKDRAIPLMLRLRVITPEPSIQALINEALALLGYIHPLPSRGIRILSIDGGGTRGIMAIEILRSLERMTQQPVHRLFDFMCGVSTGSILSVLLGALKVSMDECEELYKSTSTEIFNQSTLWGTSKLVLNHAYYDTDEWVKVLKKNMGEMPLIQTARDPTCPKIAAISTVMNEPRLQNFIFRNYDYPYRDQSNFLGSYTPVLWEAVRASAAAPGYFEEYKLGNYVHQDGGILTNNPTALAIHECRHLWPGQMIQCVVSIGNGRFEPREQLSPTYSSLKTKIMRIVDSATDTEMVHTILGDLLPPSRYFRINPYLTESVSLDETRPEKLKQLQEDATMYIRKNEQKLQQASKVLLEPKGQLQKLRDLAKVKFMTYL